MFLFWRHSVYHFKWVICFCLIPSGLDPESSQGLPVSSLFGRWSQDPPGSERVSWKEKAINEGLISYFPQVPLG